MNPALVTIGDVRRAGYCTKGARRWFERRGLDFRHFLDQGISEELFVESGCPMAADIVAKKKARNHG